MEKNMLSKLTNEELIRLRKLHKETHKEGGISKRLATIEKFGYDVKFAYHVVRLLNEVEQIMMECDLDLEKNREQLKSIRRGEWKLSDIEEYFQNKEKDLEKLYIESKLPHSPDENMIKQILMDCLEEHYGNLSECVVNVDKATESLKEIKRIIEKTGI